MSRPREIASLFACPECRQRLDGGEVDGEMSCPNCSIRYPVEEGIPNLFRPHDHVGNDDVTEIVKAFYEETPFPNYDDLDSAERLREKARSGVLARLLDEQIPPGARILEAGCGTGQLGNYLGLTPGRAVYSTDLCRNSLRLAEAFRQRHAIENTTFCQMNLFRPAFAEESFDFVICNGVLHHTSDPEGGFRSLARLVKPGGFIVIGLYNQLGRLTTDLRRLIFRATGERFLELDPRLRDEPLNEARRTAWYRDQYRHPHESKHTIGEVLGWFDEQGFDFFSGIPKPTAFDPFDKGEKLFRRHDPGGWLDHLLVQLGLIVTGSAEGGFFIMIGRKPNVTDGGPA